MVGSPLNSSTKCHCMKFNWPLGFSKLFPKNIPARFTSSFVAFSLLPAILSVCLPLSFLLLSILLFYFSHSISALSTNIPCQSIPSEISNGIVPSDDITRRFCIFHRTLTSRTTMKLSSTDRYMRVDIEKKLAGTWSASRFNVFEYSLNGYSLVTDLRTLFLARSLSQYVRMQLFSNAPI